MRPSVVCTVFAIGLAAGQSNYGRQYNIPSFSNGQYGFTSQNTYQQPPSSSSPWSIFGGGSSSSNNNRYPSSLRPTRYNTNQGYSTNIQPSNLGGYSQPSNLGYRPSSNAGFSTRYPTGSSNSYTVPSGFSSAQNTFGQTRPFPQPVANPDDARTQVPRLTVQNTKSVFATRPVTKLNSNMPQLVEDVSYSPVETNITTSTLRPATTTTTRPTTTISTTTAIATTRRTSTTTATTTTRRTTTENFFNALNIEVNVDDGRNVISVPKNPVPLALGKENEELQLSELEQFRLWVKNNNALDKPEQLEVRNKPQITLIRDERVKVERKNPEEPGLSLADVQIEAQGFEPPETPSETSTTTTTSTTEAATTTKPIFKGIRNLSQRIRGQPLLALSHLQPINQRVRFALTTPDSSLAEATTTRTPVYRYKSVYYNRNPFYNRLHLKPSTTEKTPSTTTTEATTTTPESETEEMTTTTESWTLKLLKERRKTSRPFSQPSNGTRETYNANPETTYHSVGRLPKIKPVYIQKNPASFASNIRPTFFIKSTTTFAPTVITSIPSTTTSSPTTTTSTTTTTTTQTTTTTPMSTPTSTIEPSTTSSETSSSTSTTISVPSTTQPTTTASTTTTTPTTTTTTSQPSTTTGTTTTTTTAPKPLEELAIVKFGSSGDESTTHRIPAKVFKPYPAINKPTFSHEQTTAKSEPDLVIIEAAKVVDITPEKPLTKNVQNPRVLGEFFDRYYKDGWKDKDVKQKQQNIPDFLKYAVPMPLSQRRMDVVVHEMRRQS